jgi:phosphoserine phosphatase
VHDLKAAAGIEPAAVRHIDLAVVRVAVQQAALETWKRSALDRTALSSGTASPGVRAVAHRICRR